MTDQYPRVRGDDAKPVYSLCVPHAATGAETEVFRGALSDASDIATAFARCGLTFGMAKHAAPGADPEATGRVPQLAIELAAIADAIGDSVGTLTRTDALDMLQRVHTKLLAIADRVQAEASDL